MTSEPNRLERPRRLNSLCQALHFNSYLEIGVRDGATLRAVEIASKTGVDPVFQFDWQREARQSSWNLHPCTSDVFFAGLSASSRFDLIYLDGLHHYDQSFRDLLNAVAVLGRGGVIVIDDTVPCDSYSCSRDMNEAFSLRRQSDPSASDQWHGDTYKLIPLLQLLLPAYEYVTIMGSGNPQTLVWKRNRVALSQEFEKFVCFLAMENLSACDFLWMKRNFSIWHPMQEAEALELVITDLQGAGHCGT